MHLLKLTCLDRRGNEFYKIIYLHFLKYQTFYHNFKRNKYLEQINKMSKRKKNPKMNSQTLGQL